MGAPFRRLAAVAFTTALAAPCRCSLRDPLRPFPCSPAQEQRTSKTAQASPPGQQVVRLQTWVSYRTYVGDNAINVQAVSTAAVGCLLSLISRIGQTSHSNNGDTSTPHAIGILLAHPGRGRRRFKRHCHRRTP